MNLTTVIQLVRCLTSDRKMAGSFSQRSTCIKACPWASRQFTHLNTPSTTRILGVVWFNTQTMPRWLRTRDLVWMDE